MSLSNISIEQPPEGTDPALTEYLTRQAEQVSAVFTGADVFVQRHTMPLKYTEGTVINFGSAIDPDITEPGLWLYTNYAWVQIATGDTVGGKLKVRYYAPQPLEKELGLLAYFAQPIPSEGIAQEGLYVYKSTGWAFIA